MRCLIPVHQELYPRNALARAERLCDEVILLYIVDKRLIERVEHESSYILPSYAIESVEEFVVNIHRQEAEKIKSEMKVPAELRFVVGEYYESIEKEVLKSAPDLVMCDSLMRGLLKLDVPIWIDRGLDIEECTVIVTSLKKIKRVRRSIELARNLCERLGAIYYIHYPPRDEIGIEALKPLGTVIDGPRGQLLAFLREDVLRVPEDKCVLLL
jgi:hypothetical protein